MQSGFIQRIDAQVMGRQCGYLALTAALATEADFVFVPEWPAGEDWQSTMCNRLATMRKVKGNTSERALKARPLP